jgi:hypothetical protein
MILSFIFIFRSLQGLYKPVFKRRRKRKSIQADLKPGVIPNPVIDELLEKYRTLLVFSSSLI